MSWRDRPALASREVPLPEQRDERRLRLERLAPTLLPIDHTKSRSDFVAGFLCFLGSLENGIACRAHIIDQDDDRAIQPACGSRGGKRAADVPVPPGGGQPGLCRGRADTTQGMADRQAEMAGQIRRLIEAALPSPRVVKGYGHHVPGAIENIGGTAAHQHGQPPRQRAAAAVLERLDDGAECAVVCADRPGAVDARPAAATARAMEMGVAPGRKRVAAPVAERRCQREDGLPAAAADRSARRLIERLVAGGAGRREHHRENGVQDRRESSDRRQ